MKITKKDAMEIIKQKQIAKNAIKKIADFNTIIVAKIDVLNDLKSEIENHINTLKEIEIRKNYKF